MVRTIIVAVVATGGIASAVLALCWRRDEKVGEKREQDRRRQCLAEEARQQAQDSAPLTRLVRARSD